MSDSSTPIGNLISKGRAKHLPAQNQNPSREQNGQNYLSYDVKRWIVLPVIIFQGFAFGMLVWVFFVFAYSESDLSPYAWPALIAAFAGIPFGIITKIKDLAGLVTTD